MSNQLEYSSKATNFDSSEERDIGLEITARTNVADAVVELHALRRLLLLVWRKMREKGSLIFYLNLRSRDEILQRKAGCTDLTKLVAGETQDDQVSVVVI